MDDKEPDARQRAVNRAAKGLMNIEAQEIFDRLVNLNPHELTEEDRKFITARRGYMNDRQLEVFQTVIDQVLAENTPKEEVVVDPTKTKK